MFLFFDFSPDYPTMVSKGNKPLAVIPIDETYLLGIYQGSISKYDLLVKYRQRVDDVWSRLRTPKHIHWAVDVLIKHYIEPEETDQLLDHLIDLWEKTNPISSQRDRAALLNVETLLSEVNQEAAYYPKLTDKGEYSVKFLILIAKLIMVQEKTNRNDAYMFKTLLEQLREHNDIFRIVSTATYH